MTVTGADASLARRIGARLRLRRKEQQLTLAVLAQRAGLSVSYLSAVENGVNLPSLPVLARLTEALDVSIPAVLTDEGSPFAVTGEIPAADGEVQVSHPMLQLHNTVIRAAAGDSGTATVPLEGRDLFVYVLEGTITLRVEDEPYELHRGDAIDVSLPGEVSWSSPTPSLTVWSSCPKQT